MSNDKEFKKMEYILYNYKNIIIEIKNLKLSLEELENDYRGVTAQSYEEHTQPTNSFHSDVENEVVKRTEEIQRLKNIIRTKEIQIEKINNIKESLNEDELFILTERYFNHKTNKYVAAQLNITEQTSCDYKSKLICKFVTLMFN